MYGGEGFGIVWCFLVVLVVYQWIVIGEWLCYQYYGFVVG